MKYSITKKPENISKHYLKEQLALFLVPESLDFRGLDTQYGTHALHTYVAAMVPQLAEKLVTTFVPKNEVVLDPFCGGGAVLVECIRNHRYAAGSDINPLAVLISKVKATYVERNLLEKACRYVQLTAERNLNGVMSFPEKYNVEYWFQSHTMAELTALGKIIQQCEERSTFECDVIDVLKVAFSATVRDVMLTYRNEVRLRRFKETDLKKFKPNAFKSFANRAKLAIERIPTLPKNSKVEVLLRDVQSLSYHDKYFHSIICSPPYGDEKNGVSYIQFSKFMLFWLGYTRETVAEARKKTLGHAIEDTILPSETLNQAFALIKELGGDEIGMKFYQDYYVGLQQMIRITREFIIIVIGNRILKQTLIANGDATVELMNSLGCKLYRRFKRNLPSKRLPKLRREETHGFGGAIDKEEILIFKVK